MPARFPNEFAVSISQWRELHAISREFHAVVASLHGGQKHVGGVVGIVFEGGEGVVVPFLHMVVGIQHVAVERVQFAGPPKGGAGGGVQNGRAGRRAAGQIAIAGQHAAGLREVGIDANKVAQVGVLERGEVGGGMRFRSALQTRMAGMTISLESGANWR